MFIMGLDPGYDGAGVTLGAQEKVVDIFKFDLIVNGRRMYNVCQMSGHFEDIMPDVVAFGDASVTGSVDGDTIVGHDIGTSQPWIFDLDDITIPDTEALVVRAATTGIVHVELHCFREVE